MAKRGALTDLNHDNWDQQEEDEEVGTFARASEKDLQKRVIKKAARRLDNNSESAVKSVFGGFAGFASKAAEAKPAAATFSFLSNVAVATTPPIAKQSAVEPTAGTMPQKAMNGSGSANSYNADLKELNLSFVKWVKECVDKSPLCILTPVLDDYRKYLKELDDEKVKHKEGAATEETKALQHALASSPITFKFGNVPTQLEKPKTNITFGAITKTDDKEKFTPTPFAFTTKTDQSPKTDATGFSFGAKTATQSPTPTFSGFGNAAAATAKTPFSFGATSTPFSFGNVTQAPKSAEDGPAKNDEDAENDDEPPKVEFTPVVEEDSVYDKRCKVFVKQGEEYKDRGVGTLYVKLVEDGKKTQVIVRANTNLGNLLLNTLLTTSTPTKRMGKNNVMIATVVDGKPTPVLLRVKTTEDADELLAELEKYKK